MAKVRLVSAHPANLDLWVQTPVEDLQLPLGTIQLAWMGQAGFILRCATSTLGIDLYLSDVLAQKYAGTAMPHLREHPAPVAIQSLHQLDALLCTHAHTDHMDPGTIQPLYAQRGTDSPLFVCPRAEIAKARERGAPLHRIVGLTDPETIVVPKLGAITAIPAAHETLRSDAQGNRTCLGYVLELAGVRIYHSGDCIPFAELPVILSDQRIDVALLPVNGRSAQLTAQGILGNFSVDEASALLREVGIPFFVPHHFGMFAFNTISRRDLETGLELNGWTTGTDAIIVETGIVYTLEVGPR